MSAPLHVYWSSQSDPGRRSSNDDAVLVDEQRGLYLVCDGARGRFGGRTAAELACAEIQGWLDELEQRIGPRLTPESEQVVDGVLTAAHQRVLAAQASDHTLKGMASTAVMMIHRGDEALISHIGDSRMLLLRGGQLYQITRDHNLKNYIEDNPQVRPPSNVSDKTLVRALGLDSESFGAEHRRLPLAVGDVALLCTDGLTDSVPGYTLRELLSCTTVTSIEDTAVRLIRAAIRHGSRDNISVVVFMLTDKVGQGGAATTIFEVGAGGPSAPGAPALGWLAGLDGKLKGQLVPLEGSTVLGADPDCKISLDEEFASRRHAEIYRTEYGFMVRDLGSTNGTFVNDVRIKEESLVDGDRIRVGTTELVFKSHDPVV